MRLSRDVIDYLEDVVKDTNARNMTEAVRLIIIERMLRDKEAGEIGPFTYAPAPTPRDRRIKRSRTIRTGELTTFPLGEPPANAGPLPAPLRGDITKSESEKEVKAELEASGTGEQGANGFWGGPRTSSEVSEDVLEAMRKERGELVDYVKKN